MPAQLLRSTIGGNSRLLLLTSVFPFPVTRGIVCVPSSSGSPAMRTFGACVLFTSRSVSLSASPDAIRGRCHCSRRQQLDQSPVFDLNPPAIGIGKHEVSPEDFRLQLRDRIELRCMKLHGNV